MSDRRGYLDSFPRVDLGEWPTPVQKLQGLGKQLNHNGLFIKRDDLTGLGQGGNKTRPLEFLLGDAQNKGADIVLVAGGLQSNLCSLTAAACSKMGLDCVLVHNDDKPQKLVGNMLLNNILNVQSVFLGKVDEQRRTDETERLGERLKKSGKKPYVIHNGSSTSLGALGYVGAAFELYEQMRTKGLDIKHVGIVGAMGGTAAGFVLGAALLDHPFHVHVVSVEYRKPLLSQLISEIISGALKIVKEIEGLELKVPVADVMTIYDEYLGDGYGIPTVRSRRTLFQLARAEGIFLEDVYTSKCLGGFLDLIDKGIIASQEGACYIHTGGLASLFVQDVIN